jgi:hypothetical protein
MNVSIRYELLGLGNLLEIVNNQPFYDYVDSHISNIEQLRSKCQEIMVRQPFFIGSKALDLITLLDTNLNTLLSQLENFKRAAKETVQIDIRGGWSSLANILSICLRKLLPSITDIHSFAIKEEVSIFNRVEIELIEFNFLKLAKYADFALHIAGIVELMFIAQFSGQIDPGRMHMIAFTCKVPPFWYELEDNKLRYFW